jgi:hypothetical protein
MLPLADPVEVRGAARGDIDGSAPRSFSGSGVHARNSDNVGVPVSLKMFQKWNVNCNIHGCLSRSPHVDAGPHRAFYGRLIDECVNG